MLTSQHGIPSSRTLCSIDSRPASSTLVLGARLRRKGGIERLTLRQPSQMRTIRIGNVGGVHTVTVGHEREASSVGGPRKHAVVRGCCGKSSVSAVANPHDLDVVVPAMCGLKR